MALARWQNTIQDEAGNAVSGATVTVRRELTGAALVPLYSDRDGLTPIANPVSSDTDGYVGFHVAGGAYRIDVAANGDTKTWRYVGIGLGAERDTIDPGIAFAYAAETADADPGAGTLRFNNATPGSATQIYISETDADGVSVAAWLATFDDGGDASNRGNLIFQASGGTAKVIARVTGSITDAGSYVKIPITVISASGVDSFIAGARGAVIFTSNGVNGAAGTGDMNGPASSIPGQFATFANATGKLLDAGIDGAGSPQSPLVVATTAGVQAAQDGHMIHGGSLRDASASETLSDGATVAVDWSSFINGELVIAGNRALGNPTNVIPGTWRVICVAGSGGTRTLTFGSAYKNVPTLTDIAAGKHYLLSFFARQADNIVCFSSVAFP